MPRTVFALAVAAAMFVAGFSAVSSAEYLTGLSHGMDKRRAEDPPPVADTLALRCARNEWEPFQVFVFDDAGLTGVDVNVSAFTGPGDSMETVELYRAAYVPVTAETISHSPPDVTKIGTWPDGLIPFVDHFVGEVRDGAPFDVAPGFAQAVWAEVFVPEDQAPGTYEATVTVTADGRAPWTGTVTLAVWDFVIPTGISIKSNYGYSHATVWNFHQAHGGITARRDLLSMYFREFLRHRMSLYSYLDFMPGYSWNGAADAFDWDWTEFDAYFGPLWDGTFDEPGARFTGMTLPWPPGGRPGDVDAGVWERAWWGGWADHFRAKGWLDVPFLYLPDEPNPSEYAYVAELADRLHAADPDLKAMVTEQFNEELAGHVDIWDPDEPLFSDSLPWPPYPDVYAERRAMGEETWWYNCVSAMYFFDWANHYVDYPATQMRIWLWLTRRYDFQGILFWSTVYLFNYQDPWDTQWSTTFQCQGDGTMIYPGTVDHIGGTTDIPVASLRMKYLREAMEDYEYFRLLDEAGEDAWVTDVTRTVAPKTFQWEHDWRAMLDWRRKVAEKILGTLDEVPPGPPADLSATGAIESVELAFTAPPDADLAGYDIYYAIYEGDAFFGGRLGADATSAVVTNLPPGRDVTLWIRAFDENGNRSDESESVTATPLSADDDDDAEDDDTVGGDGFSPNLVSVSDGDSADSESDAAADGEPDDAGGCGC